MGKKEFILKRFWKKFNTIKLSDRYLIVIMLILIIQSIIGLYTNIGEKNITDRVDIALRTSIASIFGYFISHNFDDDSKSTSDINTIETGEKLPSKKNIEPQKINPNDLQVKVIGMICIISLFILFSIRYLVPENNDSLAFIFLFRDLICGSIGFLIGSPSTMEEMK